MKRHAWMIGAALSAGCAAWTMWPRAAEPAAANAQASAPPAAHAATSSLSLPADWPPAYPSAADEPARVPLPPIEASAPAAQSLAQARENGDPRTPPIQRDMNVLEKPTAAEIADPAAYQRFEARRNTQLLSAYTQAAASKASTLREDIERGRAAGIPPEQISKVEEKVRRIEEMRARLLKEHPELER